MPLYEIELKLLSYSERITVSRKPSNLIHVLAYKLLNEST